MYIIYILYILYIYIYVHIKCYILFLFLSLYIVYVHKRSMTHKVLKSHRNKTKQDKSNILNHENSMRSRLSPQ